MMPTFAQTPPMFICGEVTDRVPMVKCIDCGWQGFAGGPEPGEVEEAAEARAAGEWWPDPTFQYADNHTEVVCRSWKRDHDDDDPRQRLSGKRKRAHNAFRKAHERHPAVPLRTRGDGERFCPRCGFVP